MVVKNRRGLILSKYIKLKNDLSPYVEDNSLFPPVNEIDVVELLVGIGYFFPDASCDYDKGIRNLLFFKGLNYNEEQTLKIIEIVKPFIIFLQGL